MPTSSVVLHTLSNPIICRGTNNANPASNDHPENVNCCKSTVENKQTQPAMTTLK